MSAAAALARAEAAGVRFQLAPGGGVRMEAAVPPPPEVLADLRRWREEVACLLALREGIAACQQTPPPDAHAIGHVQQTTQDTQDWRSLPYGPRRGAAFLAARLAPGACRCCAGRRWWRDESAQSALRCMICHPPTPGLAFTTLDP